MEGIVPVETGNCMHIGTQIIDSLWRNPHAGVVFGKICNLRIEIWHCNDFLNFIHACSPFKWFVGESLRTIFDSALTSCMYLPERERMMDGVFSEQFSIFGKSIVTTVPACMQLTIFLTLSKSISTIQSTNRSLTGLKSGPFNKTDPSDPAETEAALLEPPRLAGFAQKVMRLPFPFAVTVSFRCFNQCAFPASIKASAVVCEIWILLFWPVDSILDAVLTVSPNNWKRALSTSTTNEQTKKLDRYNTLNSCVYSIEQDDSPPLKTPVAHSTNVEKNNVFWSQKTEFYICIVCWTTCVHLVLTRRHGPGIESKSHG